MDYLIRREYSEKIGAWGEVLEHYSDREECFKNAKLALRDRNTTRIYVYELIDPDLWRDKKLNPETWRK